MPRFKIPENRKEIQVSFINKFLEQIPGLASGFVNMVVKELSKESSIKRDSQEHSSAKSSN